ncbi:MAG: FecR domain-containing protein [Verrucomicrobia bacterium]|nr:FecR domain-containing protein [Verrucomicrobiota bacterium]
MNGSDPRLDWLRQYAEGTASAETTAQLERALREDAAFRKLFLEYLNVDLALSTGAAHLESAAGAKVLRFPMATRRAVVAWAAAAAVVVLAGVVALWLNDLQHRTGDKVVASVMDPYLAIVVDQSPETRWSGARAPRGIGHALGRDRCRLESGEATLQLDNGVELLLRGPAELQLHSVDHGTLYRGQLSARVPPGAVGFRVDAPGLNVVDLGTEFSVAVDESGQPKVHVFKGKVRAALPAVPASRTELTAGESARFDAARGTARRGPEDPALFPALEDDARLPRTTGQVRYLRKAPPSVRAGTYEHDAIMVFEEQADFTLPENLAVIRAVSNQQDGPEPSVPERVTLPAGTRVRSYYVHFDRVGTGARDVESKGSITFDRPVLGLVIPAMALKQTDAWLARAGTAYETSGSQLLEIRFMGWKTYKSNPNTSGRFDEVHLGTDGRTATMDLLTGWAIDQFRILVAAD